MADETDIVTGVSADTAADTAAVVAAVVEEQPVFDFGRLSWGESLDMDAIRARLNAVTGQDLVEQKAAILAFQSHVCRVLVGVPRSWVVDHAPPFETLDWAKGETLFWLKKAKFKKLIDAWNVASEFDAASGE